VGFRPVERMSEAACRSLTIPACALQASAAEKLVNVISNSRVMNRIVCKSLSCEHKQCDVHRIQAINTRRHYAMLQFRLAVTFQRQIVDTKSHTFNFACSDSVVFPISQRPRTSFFTRKTQESERTCKTALWINQPACQKSHRLQTTHQNLHSYRPSSHQGYQQNRPPNYTRNR
jgi:hypothetical protein